MSENFGIISFLPVISKIEKSSSIIQQKKGYSTRILNHLNYYPTPSSTSPIKAPKPQFLKYSSIFHLQEQSPQPNICTNNLASHNPKTISFNYRRIQGHATPVISRDPTEPAINNAAKDDARTSTPQGVTGKFLSIPPLIVSLQFFIPFDSPPHASAQPVANGVPGTMGALYRLPANSPTCRA